MGSALGCVVRGLLNLGPENPVLEDFLVDRWVLVC